MFKMGTIDNFDEKTLKKLKKDTVYKVKDKALVVFKDGNVLMTSFATRGDTTTQHCYGYESTNYATAIRAIYYNQYTVYRPQQLLERQYSILDDPRTVEEVAGEVVKRLNQENSADIELGVEMELEPENDEDLCYDSGEDYLEKEITDIDKKDLVERVCYDCSVYGHSELNLTHMTMKKWERSGVKKLLNDLRTKLGLDGRYGTAGMHVHISGKNIVEAVREVNKQKEDIGRFLNLIGFRRGTITIPDCEPGHDKDGGRFCRYGTNENAIREQLSGHGTVEFRCFEATTDYDLFMVRLKFVQEVFKYLGHKYKIKDFAKKANKRARGLFMQLYNDPRNPHAFGVLTDEQKQMMEA